MWQRMVQSEVRGPVVAAVARSAEPRPTSRNAFATAARNVEANAGAVPEMNWIMKGGRGISTN